jgi:hypothetical protein
MNCAIKNSVYAYSLMLLAFTQSTAVLAKGGTDKEGVKKTTTASITPTTFEWKEHSKLSWEDFRGPVGNPNDATVAVTHCGMGFKTGSAKDGEKPEITVFNKFYTEKSWVMGDAKLPEILEHEQGHFDLCELYTRKLRVELEKVDFSKPNARKTMYDVYYQVNAEYEERQQQYEDETTHGTIDKEQKRWTATIGQELNTSGDALSSNVQ